MIQFGQNTTTASSTFGTTTVSTGSLFGGTDATKTFQPTPATVAQDNKPSIFGGSSFGSFSFGAKTTTTAPTNLFSTATTSAGGTFGTVTPVSFDFGSPPNQTVGSPGFGTPQQQQQTPQTLGFGTLPQQQQPQPQQQKPTSVFASSAQTVTSSAPFSTQTFSFKSATTEGYGFTTSGSGFSTAVTIATATTATAPQTTQSFFSAASTTTTNLGSTPAPSTLSFGQIHQPPITNINSSFAFSTAPNTVTQNAAAPTLTASTAATTNPDSSASFMPSSTPYSFSYGQTMGFAQPQPTTASQPTTLKLSSTTTSGFSFAPKASLSFATATTQANLVTPASITLGTPASITLGTPVSINLGTKPQAILHLGPSAISQPNISLGTTTTLPTLNLGTTTSMSSGMTFPKPTPTPIISSTVSAPTPVGISTFGKTTVTTTMPSLANAIPAAPPQAITSLTFGQLELHINKWTQELEEQEKTFINQATQLNAWDRLVIINGEKLVELDDAVNTLKGEQESLEYEIGFVMGQQKELEDLLSPLEKQLLVAGGDMIRDPEREHMYSLAVNMEKQMRLMTDDLKQVIEYLNEADRSQDSKDPLVQIGRILNAHMSSMQWVDNSIAQICTKLDQLKTTHDTLRRDNERSFQKAYK